MPYPSAPLAAPASPLALQDPLEIAPAIDRWLLECGEELREFSDHRDGDLATEIEREVTLQRLLWQAGWTRLGWPEDCGGLGGGALHRAAVYESLWAGGIVVPEGLQSLEVLGPVLVTHGRELARTHMAPYIRGEYRLCQAFSEPQAGSDLGAIATSTERDGGHYLLNGQKVWSSLGAGARFAVVLVRTDRTLVGNRGLSLLIVDLRSPGVIVRAIPASTGRDEFAELFFGDVTVDAANLIGPEGAGWEMAMYILQWERGMYAWQRQAYLLRRLADAARRTTRRDVHAEILVGRACVAIHALRARSRQTVGRLAGGEQPGPEISVDKVLLASAEQLVYETIRVLADGALELVDDHQTALWRSEWFYARAASVYGGAGEVQRDILAERVLGLPREPRGGR